MKISTKGRYAVRVMIEIASHSTEEKVSIHEISERQNISEKYLEQIVRMLTKNKMLIAYRGALGGYQLAKSPVDYTLLDILVCTEGDLAPVACLQKGAKCCPRKKECETFSCWEGLNKVICDYLSSITLADIIQGKNGGEYCI